MRGNGHSSIKFVNNDAESCCADISSVECITSPHFFCYIGKHSCSVTIDTGAMSNLISLDLARSCGLKIKNYHQWAR